MREYFSSEELPPGPADTVYQERSLAYLAVVKATAHLADHAVRLAERFDTEGLVLDSEDLIQYAQEVHDRVVVYQTVTDPYYPTYSTQSDELYKQWISAIERPWERRNPDSSEVFTTLPLGLHDPAATAAELDEWCAKHFTKAPEPRAISEALDKHNAESQARSVARHAEFPATQTDVTDIERLSHEARVARIDAPRTDDLLGSSETPPFSWDNDHLIRVFWEAILSNVLAQHTTLTALVGDLQAVRVSDDLVVMGHPDDMAAAALAAVGPTFERAIQETTGLGNVSVRVLQTEALQAIQDEAETPPF